jgi:nicotinamidase-related amidase
MKVLLVVDVQNDFVTGALANPEAQAKIPAIKEKLQQRLAEGWTVVFTKDTHYDNYSTTMEGRYLPVPHCIERSWGWELVDGIKEIEESQLNMTICKNRFGDEVILEHIGNNIPTNWKEAYPPEIEEIELIGFCTDICVVSNALILKASVSNETIISCDASCCAGTSIEAHNAALRVMQSCQVEVRNA